MSDRPIGEMALGKAIDRIWSYLPSDHYLRYTFPLEIGAHDDAYWFCGTAAVNFCVENGVVDDVKLHDSERDTWIRLIGVWINFLRDNPYSTRLDIAKSMGVDSSNVSNYLNGRRPLTRTSLDMISVALGVEPCMILPDAGLQSARRVIEDFSTRIKHVKSQLLPLRKAIDEIKLSPGNHSTKLIEELLAEIERAVL